MTAAADGALGRDIMTAAADGALAEALAASDRVARLFSAAGHRLYLVGGVVRDAMAGSFFKGADLDCTTDAPPAAVRRVVGPAATSVWAQGERYGTIGCVVDGQAFEITTHRAERYNDGSRKPAVAFGTDVVADLARRDFTVNAMAVDTCDGTLLDPHGGRGDLAAGVLRTPLDPEVSFADDPLRMLRAARFIAGHGLAPAPGVADAVRTMGGRLSIVATERVRDELEKLLLLADPTGGLRFLFDAGLVERVLPSHAGRDAAALGRVVAAVKAEPAARWAALFVEDPAPAVDADPAAAACLRAMRCSTALTDAAVGLLSARSLLASASSAAPGVRRLVHACPVDVDSALDFARAVAAARDEPTAPLDSFSAALADLRRREDVDDPRHPLTGDDVMALLGLEPGSDVGRALAFLRERAFEEGPIARAAAEDALRQWWAAGYGAGP